MRSGALRSSGDRCPIKQSERGDDEQVSGSGQRVQSARAKPLQTLDCRMSASCGRKAERENKGRQQQQASAPLGAAHPYRKWNRNGNPPRRSQSLPLARLIYPMATVPGGRGRFRSGAATRLRSRIPPHKSERWRPRAALSHGHDHEKWQTDRRSRRQSSVEGGGKGYHQAQDDAGERDAGF